MPCFDKLKSLRYQQRISQSHFTWYYIHIQKVMAILINIRYKTNSRKAVMLAGIVPHHHNKATASTLHHEQLYISIDKTSMVIDMET